MNLLSFEKLFHIGFIAKELLQINPFGGLNQYTVSAVTKCVVPELLSQSYLRETSGAETIFYWQLTRLQSLLASLVHSGEDPLVWNFTQKPVPISS